MDITVGAKIRELLHPPGRETSFVEGIVRRIDVTTSKGRGFMIAVTREVVLGRDLTVRPGYMDFVLYERPDDFEGRLEILAADQADEALIASAPSEGLSEDIVDSTTSTEIPLQFPSSEALPEQEAIAPPADDTPTSEPDDSTKSSETADSDEADASEPVEPPVEQATVFEETFYPPQAHNPADTEPGSDLSQDNRRAEVPEQPKRRRWLGSIFSGS